MRRDLIIGIIIALALHAGAAYIGEMFGEQEEVAVVTQEENLIEVYIPPPLPEEEPEVIESMDPTQETVEFTPPMQQDMPQLATPDAFVQPVQPPPPESLRPTTEVVTIPTGNLYASVGEIFDIALLDQQPVPLVQARPVYPASMRKQAVRGEVVVRFIVTSQGNVTQARVVESTQSEFDREALNAIQKWKFKPGRKGGRDVATFVEVPIIFSIQ
jgi:protein TonB